MYQILRHYGVKWIWHFTDRSNIESIKKHGGLLSLKELNKRGIAIPSPGGNDWSHDADEQKGVHTFVHLCFLSDHPMLFVAQQDGRIKDPFWFKIDVDVMLHPDVRFSPDVSNKSGVPILDLEEAKNQLDFQVLFTRMNWGDPTIYHRRQMAEKSEILVPKIVPLDKILNL